MSRKRNFHVMLVLGPGSTHLVTAANLFSLNIFFTASNSNGVGLQVLTLVIARPLICGPGTNILKLRSRALTARELPC